MSPVRSQCEEGGALAHRKRAATSQRDLKATQIIGSGEHTMSAKVVAAINSMNKQGHDARIHRYHGKVWIEIDRCMLASFDEIEAVVDGVHTFEDLTELFKKRHAEEMGNTAAEAIRSKSVL
jgi:hypothetical protein